MFVEAAAINKAVGPGGFVMNRGQGTANANPSGVCLKVEQTGRDDPSVPWKCHVSAFSPKNRYADQLLHQGVFAIVNGRLRILSPLGPATAHDNIFLR